MLNGWIVLWREIEEHPVWATAEQRLVVLMLLMNAAWKERRVMVGGKEITLKPGQILSSRKELAKKALVSERQLRTSLEHLEKLGFSTSQTSSRGTLITIVNWGKWQGGGGESDQPSDQPSTSHRPATDQPIHEQGNQVTSNTTNNNNRARAYIGQPENANSTVTTVERVESQECTNLTEKTGTQVESSVKGKKPRKNFVEPTVEEVESYIKEMGYHFDAELFCAYYGARGWILSGGRKMVDWKKACVTWERKEANGKRQRGFSQNLHKPAGNGRSTGRGQSPDAWRGITADNFWKS